MNFTVLGSGRWGSFITWYLTYIGHNVTEWGRPSSASFAELMKTRKNEYVDIPNSVHLTTDIDEALSDADAVIISIKSQALRSLAKMGVIHGLDKKNINEVQIFVSVPLFPFRLCQNTEARGD